MTMVNRARLRYAESLNLDASFSSTLNITHRTPNICPPLPIQKQSEAGHDAPTTAVCEMTPQNHPDESNVGQVILRPLLLSFVGATVIESFSPLLIIQSCVEL